MTISRRRLLRTSAAGAALGAGASLLPASVHTAMAAPMRAGGLDAIEHVVVLMQENRSFDHYFGTLRGVRGFGDRTPLRLPDGEFPLPPGGGEFPLPPGGGRTVFEQPADGRDPILPFSLRRAAALAGRPGADIQYLDDLNHDFPGSTAAWAQGWNNGWIAAKTAATMTHYDRTDIPLQHELADTFTICDAYHCSVFGSTNPNRNYLWTGTTGFELGTTQRAVSNAAYDYAHPGYDWTTYPERLQAAGVSWQIYQEWDNFTDNPVEYFLPFKAIGTKMLASVEGAFRTTEELYDTINKATPADAQRLLAQLAAGRDTLTDAERELFDKAMYRSEPETLVERVRADITAGTLPAVTWLVPSAIDSEHPGASTPVGSATLIHDLLDALATDPDTWSRTALFVNFDENDGYFDHVPPPIAPRPESGHGDDWYDGRPVGLGPRVPMTVVSPWTIGGHVDSQVYDHTSVIRFLERWTGVAEPNISAWRRSVCGDLTAAFDFRRAGTAPRVDRPGPVPAPIERWHPDAPATGALPAQEPGTRPARALPYQLTVAVEGDSLELRNAGSSAAAVTIYPYAAGNPRQVELTDTHVETIDGGEYRVQGPNRFWVELAGAAPVAVGTRVLARRGGLEFTVRNTGPAPLTVSLRALGYGDRTETVDLRPGRDTAVAWPTQDGWYDVEITTAAAPSWRRRITGHVETGRPSVSA